MNKTDLMALLHMVQAGTISCEEAHAKLKLQPYEELDYAKVDLHRGIRQGVPEVIYGAGKTQAQIAGIVQTLHANGEKNILITKLAAPVAAALQRQFPMEYCEIAHLAVAYPVPIEKPVGNIVVVSAGTSDMPVAEEAARTAEVLGSYVVRLYDTGVAGIHRLLANAAVLGAARVIVVVAGMEGALASVVGGLVDCPVIAVPTSVGYGACFGGVTALLAMLNSCASGVSVVNIDNGFGAGYQASLINQIGL